MASDGSGYTRLSQSRGLVDVEVLLGPEAAYVEKILLVDVSCAREEVQGGRDWRPARRMHPRKERFCRFSMATELAAFAAFPSRRE